MTLPGQEQAPTDIVGWAHVTLSARDHDRSVGRYAEVPGLRAVASETTERWQRTLCRHPAGTTSPPGPRAPVPCTTGRRG